MSSLGGMDVPEDFEFGRSSVTLGIFALPSEGSSPGSKEGSRTRN